MSTATRRHSQLPPIKTRHRTKRMLEVYRLDGDRYTLPIELADDASYEPAARGEKAEGCVDGWRAGRLRVLNAGYRHHEQRQRELYEHVAGRQPADPRVPERRMSPIAHLVGSFQLVFATMMVMQPTARSRSPS